MTFPDITLHADHYRIAATIPGRTVATAVRTAWGWHIPLAPVAGSPRWTVCDSTQDATVVVYAVAARRMGVGR